MPPSLARFSFNIGLACSLFTVFARVSPALSGAEPPVCNPGAFATFSDEGWRCEPVTWSALREKPLSFTPEPHVHDEQRLRVATTEGGSDGNSVEFDEDARLHLKTRQRWVLDEGHRSDLIRLQWTAPRAKPALSWLDEKGDNKAAIIAHAEANNDKVEDHRHLSIETTMSPDGPYPGQLFTRMEFPYDADISEIQVHDARLTMAGHYMRISNDNGAAKELRFSRTYSKRDRPSIFPQGYDAQGIGIGPQDYNQRYSARWSVRADASPETGGNTGADFAITRFADDGLVAMDSPLTISRATGTVGINLPSHRASLQVSGLTTSEKNLLFSHRIRQDGASRFEPRWALRTDASEETGDDSGSNFKLVGYADDGAELQASLSVDRATSHVGIATDAPTAALDINGVSFRVRGKMTPEASSDPRGTEGEWAWDDSFVYVKTSSGWKRAALQSF